MRSTSHRSRKGGGVFGDRWNPPKTSDGAEPQGVVLFPGEYKIPVSIGKRGKEQRELDLPYYVAFEHYYATKRRGAPCSAGISLISDGPDSELTWGNGQCPACYHIDDGVGGISRRLVHVFNAVLLGHFHLIDSDRVDASNKPYKDWTECEGKRCKYCSSGSDRVYGRRVYWQLGTRFVNTLTTHAQTVLSKRCKCGGEITPIGFQCEACGDVIRDLDAHPASREEIATIRRTSAACPHCGVVDVPEEVPECDSCKKAQPLTLWDVQLHVARQGEGTDTTLMISEWKPISDKLLARIESRMKPYNFAETLFKPQTPAQQAKRLGIPDPYTDATTRSDVGGVDWDGDE